jgi:hypothetical protein
VTSSDLGVIGTVPQPVSKSFVLSQQPRFMYQIMTIRHSEFPEVLGHQTIKGYTWWPTQQAV